MCKVNMNTFDDGQPEEFLSLIINFNIETDGTRTTNPYIHIACLHMMLSGQALREFYKPQSQYGGATNKQPKLIQEVLLEYFFLINAISKQKRVMRRAMRKPQSMTSKRFCGKVDRNQQLPAAFPRIRRFQRKLKWKSSTILSSMQCPMDGPSNPT